MLLVSRVNEDADAAALQATPLLIVKHWLAILNPTVQCKETTATNVKRASVRNSGSLLTLLNDKLKRLYVSSNLLHSQQSINLSPNH